MVFADWALGCSVLSAIFAVRWWYKSKKNMATKKNRVSLHLDPADYEVVKAWAERCGETVTDYAHRALVESVPAAERERLANKTRGDVVEAAFAAIDDSDDSFVSAPGMLPIPPGRRPQRGVLTEAEQTHPMQRVVKTGRTTLPSVPPGPHPCVHLNVTPPAHLLGLCQGTCEHREQRGRPCNFAPTIASHCDYFETVDQIRRGH